MKRFDNENNVSLEQGVEGSVKSNGNEGSVLKDDPQMETIVSDNMFDIMNIIILTNNKQNVEPNRTDEARSPSKVIEKGLEISQNYNETIKFTLSMGQTSSLSDNWRNYKNNERETSCDMMYVLYLCVYDDSWV